MLTPLRRGSRSARLAYSLTLCASLGLLTSVGLAGNGRPITNPKYNPDAERVGLFDGMNAEQLDARMIMQNSKNGFMLVENKTNQPITVDLPPGLVGVHILPQVGGFGGGGLGGGGLGGGGLGGGGLGGGGGQNIGGGGGLGGGLGGGGLGGGGLGGGGVGGGGGGNFFSIPAQRVVRVPLHSVCLNHGKPEPKPQMTYRPVPVEEYTSDPVLQEMIETVAKYPLPPQVAQAATWHVTDNMSWQQLAAKTINTVNRGRVPYFSRQELILAQRLVAKVQENAKKRKPKKQVEEVSPGELAAE